MHATIIMTSISVFLFKTTHFCVLKALNKTIIDWEHEFALFAGLMKFAGCNGHVLYPRVRCGFLSYNLIRRKDYGFIGDCVNGSSQNKNSAVR